MVEISQLWNDKLYADKQHVANTIFRDLLDNIEDIYVLRGICFRYNKYFFFLRIKAARDKFPVSFQVEDWLGNVIVPQKSYHTGWIDALHKYLSENIRKIIRESNSLQIYEEGTSFGQRKVFR